MNRFDRFNDGFDDDVMDGGFDEDCMWDDPQPMGPMPFGRQPGFMDRNARYNNAFGDYRGGYGPGGGFGPRRRGPMNFMGPPQPMPPPPLMMGRGYGPGGPRGPRPTYDARAVRYLLRCGMSKENVKNLPRDLLGLIQPENCGLCAQSFDSFTMSRMHYISKNHLKNQKRWLSQKPEGRIQRQHEVPLKARDLYCELCDVHITSKSHADAHYAGKPHRAIVEGRRNPKNPLLLQNGMQGRVEQLIRREKRTMKKEEVAVAAEPESQSAKELKNVPPELICEICETAVTCSEQMTMHLNGKKHLSKEKQHILKMMKGDPPAAASATENENTEEEAKKEEEEEVEQEEEQAADDDDWGTEAWDNQEKPQEAENQPAE